MRRTIGEVVRIDGHNYKRCTKCRQLKLANYETFHKKLAGFSPWCIECERERVRVYGKTRKRKPRRHQAHYVVGSKDPYNLYGRHGSGSI